MQRCHNLLSIYTLFFLALLGMAFPTEASERRILFIDGTEGGETSKRNIKRLEKYLQTNACAVDVVSSNTSQTKQTASFIFTALDKTISDSYQKQLSILTVDNEAISTSILVRNSTGIKELKSLQGVRFATLNKSSTLGYLLPLAMLYKADVNIDPDKLTLVQSNISAISLLLHKDVFAAAITTPLAKKWAKANDLRILATSNSLLTGGILVHQETPRSLVQQCLKALTSLSRANTTTKKVSKVFPAWIERFTEVK